MAKLEGIDADTLRDRLASTESPKAVRRLMIALAYEDGESVGTLSRRYGFPRSTIYYWLDRFESRPLEAALDDDPRPGRPRQLSDEERRELAEVLADPPTDHGYDAEKWTAPLVKRYIADVYGVEYSRGHVRRLLREEFDPSN
jgi:transposase